MVLFAKGSYRQDSKKAKTGRILIPANLVKDSSFPLMEGYVKIVIYKDRLVIKNVIERTTGKEIASSIMDLLYGVMDNNLEESA